MERKYAERLKRSFKKTLLDSPVPNRKIKFFPSGNKSKTLKSKLIKLLPDPLQPTKYVAPPPKPKPRTKKVRPPAPVPMPRSSLYPKPIAKKVKELIDIITPYYRPEAIRKFDQELRDKKNLRVRIKEKDRALRNHVKSFEVAIIERGDPAKQLYYTTNDVARELEDLLNIERGLKAYVTLKISMKKKKLNEDGEEYFIYKEPYFSCKAFTIMNTDEIIDALDQAAEEINNKIATWVTEGSGWTIEEILQHYVNIVKYVPLRGNSYIPLPEELRNSKKGLINLKNEDDKCFLWCHVRHLNPQKDHPYRIKLSDKEFAKKLDYSGITFPVTIKQISQIERQNRININVFGYDKAVYPIRISKEKYEDHLDLLYIEEKEEEKEKECANRSHVYIEDFNSLMSSFTKHEHRKHFCMHCLQCFYSNDDLEKHRENCIAINGVQAIELPKIYIDKDGLERIPSVYFQNYHKQLPLPFVIYADFESITEKITTCQPSDQKSYTQTYQRHTACSFGYKVVCHYDKKYSKPVVIYRKPDAVYKFLVSMLLEVHDLQKVIRQNFNEPLNLTEEEEEEFQRSTHC